MGISQMAIVSTKDLHMKTKELVNVWEEYVLGKNVNTPKLRNLIYDSWQRCLQHGVNPNQKQTEIVMTDDQLKEKIQQCQLIDAAKPILDQLAFQSNATGYLLTLCDKDGTIIYLNGNKQVLREGEKMNFVLGADWSEKTAGTNAIGTSIVSQKPVQVFSAEHFCEGCHPWTCSSSPIIHPITKEVLGALDLTGIWHEAQPHTLGLVISGAYSIQQRLLNNHLEIHLHMLKYYEEAVSRHPNTPMFILNRGLQMIKANNLILSQWDKDFWNQIQKTKEWNSLLQHLRNGSEGVSSYEIEVPSLPWKIYMEPIFTPNELAGFLVLLLPKTEKNNSLPPILLGNMIAQSQKMKEILYKCSKVTNVNVPIFINGESGTGKERIARTIHENSNRKNHPFIAINCGAIPADLMASEMFGYEAGTFTGGKKDGKKGKFEEAHGGTLFLDEIGEMPLDLQVHLLRVLQEKEVVRLGSSKPIPVDVRIITATHKNLEKLVEEGKFREDLFFRIHVVSLSLPPLRERKEDILLLAHSFLKDYSDKYGKSNLFFARETLDFFQSYHWPGNIREMQNLIQHCVLFCDEETIRLSHLPTFSSNYTATRKDQLTPLELEEKKMLLRFLKDKKGNLSAIARECKMARSTLYRKLKKYNLSMYIK